ncbi:MAG TPA: division plane positioning ATPase MipZ [Dongiaceae bacterium]|nr:division plane positioning ATPase MipZ [Dongiaceae bacterium]
MSRPHVIVLGNEKGGSGKSTTAMHLIVALLHDGYRVGSIDLDARQGSLTRYVENRKQTNAGMLVPLPQSIHFAIERSSLDSATEGRADEDIRLSAAMAQLADCDYVVIDTPGADTSLSRLGHTLADTLITPLNDSFLDLDLLGRVDADGAKILKLSVYSEMVWEQRKTRALRGGKPIDWVVMRSRLSSLDAKNKRDIGQLLQQLAKRIGFRVAPGFTERVIFRELFPRGLTLLDLSRKDTGVAWRMSHVAARQEVRDLIDALGLKAPSPATGAAPAPGNVTATLPPAGQPPQAPTSQTPASQAPASQTAAHQSPAPQHPVAENPASSEDSDLPIIRFSTSAA